MEADFSHPVSGSIVIASSGAGILSAEAACRAPRACCPQSVSAVPAISPERGEPKQMPVQEALELNQLDRQIGGLCPTSHTKPTSYRKARRAMTIAIKSAQDDAERLTITTADCPNVKRSSTGGTGLGRFSSTRWKIDIVAPTANWSINTKVIQCLPCIA
jgi:hypothetical protein